VIDPPEPVPFPEIATSGGVTAAIARAEKLLQ
jgi:hypothetical protein